jgi:uncharacterized protein (UPF0248 family)
MQPIHELLSRIRWDADFAKGRFEIGYYDRITRRVQVVPLSSISLSAEDPGTFVLIDEEGAAHHIPLHRVRSVYKNGELIWQRPSGAKQPD